MSFLFRLVLGIYKRSDLQTRKVIKILLELTRRAAIWLGDPTYSIDIRGQKMVLPVSHKLPIYILDYPLYDTLPARIASYLRAKDRNLIMMDIGANVGDTILACRDASYESKYLGVEANPRFVRYLRKNTADISGFILVEAFCHSGLEEQVNISIESIGGTARIRESEGGIPILKRTVDEILDEYNEFRDVNFLKLDTDGNDFDVIRGAVNCINANKPIILMECEFFENANYVNDILNVFDVVKKAGYSKVIAYDNFGNYFCTITVGNHSNFLDAIAYQLCSGFGYFDLLMLPDADVEFVQIEKEFFAKYSEKKGMLLPMQKALGISFVD